MNVQATSSGLAQSIPLEHTPYYSIEYPGYVAPQSVPKAIERLGGSQIVTDTFKRTLKIDLRLKDNDPFAHPPSGQTVATHNLLLKVVRRKRKQSPLASNGSESGSLGQFTAEILGPIHKTIRFRNPIDFQYRPPKDDPVVQLRDAMVKLDANYILSYRLPDEKEDYAISTEDQDSRGLPSSSNARIMPPPLFTPYDLPINYNFKQKSGTTEQVLVDKITGERTTRLVHAGRQQDTYPITIKWNEPSPDSCGKERDGLRSIVIPELLKKIEGFLHQRPIWTRLGIMNQLSADEVRQLHNCKQIWAICSYSFQDGPWRDSVLRIGYDPRQEPEALMYQIVSLRNLKNPSVRHSMLQSSGSTAGSQRDRNAHIFDGVHVRTAGTFQFCDITDATVRSLIDDPRNRSETCNDRDGWLDHTTAERIKNLMKFKHQRLCDTGIPPSEEECARLLAPMESTSKRPPRIPTKKKRAKARENMPEEEIAARRLELTVSQMAMEGVGDDEVMDVD